jgi:hypothetical protein
VRNVGESTENLRRMLSPRLEQPDPRMFDDNDPQSDLARREYGEQYTEMMRREWYSIGVHLGYVYEGSPIVVPDGTPRPPLQTSSYTPTARPGSRAPHAWLGENRSTLDLFGKGFVLMRLGDDPPPADSLVRAAAKAHLPLDVVDVVGEDVARLYERRLVLVRPDGQVAWRGDALPEDATTLVETVRGAIAGEAEPLSFEAVIAEA